MYKIKIFICIIASISLGCSATSVIQPGSSSKSKYAPINEEVRTGIIRYLNQGASFVRNSRREDAYKKMYNFCNGKYTILNEGIRSEGGVITPIGNSATFSDIQYVYIEYRCVK